MSMQVPDGRFLSMFPSPTAEIAQLVELLLPKQVVEGSSPFFRSLRHTPKVGFRESDGARRRGSTKPRQRPPGRVLRESGAVRIW